MWITKLLVEKLDKEDKKIDDKISEETISEKEIIKNGCLIGFLEGMTDVCLFIGAMQIIVGTLKLITKK